MMIPEVDTQTPFLGLRPFNEADRPYFCGRRTHAAEVMQRLATTRFVAVVGLSGSGKSSLVRAGVIPELRGDRLKNTSSGWAIAMTTPETSPLKRLTHELVAAVRSYAGPDAATAEAVDSWAANVPNLVDGGSSGLADAIRCAPLPRRTSVLLIVDQFEELFRYQQRRERDAAEGFIYQLLEVARALKPGESRKATGLGGAEGLTPPSGIEATEAAAAGAMPEPFYVIITMRSEYLGDCARYEGLAEAVNAGLYLTPRLNREQLREAITVPARKAGREIDTKLVTRLINDVTNDQDQLPVLQHALMRCWQKASGAIDQSLYKSIGATEALDLHAEGVVKKILAQAPNDEARNRSRQVVERLFKRLTKQGNTEGIRDAEKDGVRDPATLETICRQIDCSLDEACAVIEAFRTTDRAFLRPGPPATLDGESMIDITHESLIRKWATLQKWVKQEAEAAEAYRHLLTDARLATDSDVLPPRQVGAYLAFTESGAWREAWAERYGGSYREAIAYLEKSRLHYIKVELDKKAQHEAAIQRKHDQELEELRRVQEQTRKRWRRWIWRLGFAGLAGALVVVVWLTAQNSAIETERQFEQLIRLATEALPATENRITSAIKAAKFVKDQDSYWRRLFGTSDFDTNPRISLDQWELFGSLAGTTIGNTPVAPGKYSVDAGSASLHPSGNMIAVADGDAVRVWSLADEVRLLKEISYQGVSLVRFSPDGSQMLAAAGRNAPYSVQRFRVDNWGSDAPYSLPDPVSERPRPCWICALSFIGNSPNFAIVNDAGEVLIYDGSEPIVMSLLNGSRAIPPQTKGGDPAAGQPSPIGPTLDFARFDRSGKLLLGAWSVGDFTIVDLSNRRLLPARRQRPEGGGPSEERQKVSGKSAGAPTTGNGIGSQDIARGGMPRINSAVFSDDGTTVAIGTQQGQIEAYSTEDGGRLGQTAVEGGVTALELSDKGGMQFLAVGTSAGSAHVFGLDVRGRRLVPSRIRLQIPSELTEISVVRWITLADETPNNTLAPAWLIATGLTNAHMFDNRFQIERMRVVHDRPTVFTAATASGVVSLSEDGQVRLTRRRQDSGEVLEQRNCAAEASALSSDGTTWATACRGVITLDDGNYISSHGVVLALTFDKSGRTLSWIDVHDATTYEIHVASKLAAPGGWTVVEPNMSGSLTVFSSTPPILAMSSTANWLAVAIQARPPSDSKQRSSVRVFAVKRSAGTLPSVEPGPTLDLAAQVTSLAVSDDGSIAAGTRPDASALPLGGSETPSIRWYRGGQSWDPAVTRLSAEPTALAFTVDGTRLITAFSDRTIRALSANDGSFIGDAIRIERIPSRYLVSDAESRRFAAFAGGDVLVFSNGPHSLTAPRSLRENGNIQAFSFVENDEILTSVQITEAIAMLKHNISVDKQIEVLCKHLPVTSQTAKDDCASIHPLNPRD